MNFKSLKIIPNNKDHYKSTKFTLAYNPVTRQAVFVHGKAAHDAHIRKVMETIKPSGFKKLFSWFMRKLDPNNWVYVNGYYEPKKCIQITQVIRNDSPFEEDNDLSLEKNHVRDAFDVFYAREKIKPIIHIGRCPLVLERGNSAGCTVKERRG